MTDQQIMNLAIEEGFAAAAVISTDLIPFDFSFRPYCEENLCGQYGANYSCPPDCGTCEQMRSRIMAKKRAVVLQTIWEISDYSDRDAIRDAKAFHNQATQNLMKKMRLCGTDGFMVGASGCGLCKPCAITEGLPCRFPDLKYSCMSAYCIFVRELCNACHMDYDCGPGLLGFFGMYVFND